MPAALLLTLSPGTLTAQDTMEELGALYWARQKEAMSRFTQADVDFMVRYDRAPCPGANHLPASSTVYPSFPLDILIYAA